MMELMTTDREKPKKLSANVGIGDFCISNEYVKKTVQGSDFSD